MATEPHLPEGSAAVPEGCRVQIGTFDGPLDLLLHLVRINEVDITNLPVLTIARQYDEYLDLMRSLDLDVAGDYLVMAATLLHIKSRMLLPPDPSEAPEAPDPRAELVLQLVEHQRFKQAAETLQAIDSARGLVWTRDGHIPAEFAGEELLTVDLFDLLAAFRSLLGRLDEEVKLHLRRDDVSVADKIGWLTELLEGGRSLQLEEVFRMLPNRIERIATFLAVLEMLRLQLLVVFQRKRLAEIRIALRADPLEPADGEASPAPQEDAPSASLSEGAEGEGDRP